MTHLAFALLALTALGILAAQHAYWSRRLDATTARLTIAHDEEAGRLSDDLEHYRQQAADWKNLFVAEQERAALNSIEADRYRRAFTAKVLHEARVELMHPDAPWGGRNVVVIDEARIRRDLGLRGAK